MKLFIALLFSMAFSSYAVNDVSVPYSFSDSGVIYASQHNANFDTLETAINRNKDTMDLRFIRFTDLSSGDSTLQYLKVDTIRSNPDIDSIRGLNVMRGNPDIDSIQGLKVVRGNPNIDSISGSPIINAVTVVGTALVDSLFSTKGINATIGTFSGTVNVDSLKSTKGINSTTGNFSGVVNVDSLKSTKGVNGTIGTFSDSVFSSKGKFTGTVMVDSLYSTKGIAASNYNVSIVTCDSLKFNNFGALYASYEYHASICTLDTDAGYKTGNLNGVRFGKLVSFMIFAGLSDSITGTPAYLQLRPGSIPAAFRPVNSSGRVTLMIPAMENGVAIVGKVVICEDGSALIYKADETAWVASTSIGNGNGFNGVVSISYYLY